MPTTNLDSIFAAALKRVLNQVHTPSHVIAQLLKGHEQELDDGILQLLSGLAELNKPAPLRCNWGEDFITTRDDTDFPGQIDMSRLEAVPILKEGEFQLPNNMIVARAEELGAAAFGVRHGQYILDHWWELPRHLWIDRGINTANVLIIFPGTLQKCISLGTDYCEGILVFTNHAIKWSFCLSEINFAGSNYYFLRYKI